MKLTHSLYSKAAAAALALAALGTASVAQARGDVHWSIGVHAAPGISVGFSNAYPVYPVYSAPVYVAPPPVVYYPRVRPVRVYYGPGYYYGPTYYRAYGPRAHWRHRPVVYRY